MAVNINWNRNQQKNPGMEYDPEKPLGQQLMNYVHHMKEERLRSESKEDYERRIYAKLQAGKKLTAEEMSYLARTNPLMYQKALKVQLMRRALENSLKNCRSKEESQDIFSAAIGNISDSDPDKAMIVAALNDAYREFVESREYKELPETREEAEENNKKGRLEFETNENGYQEVFLTQAGEIPFSVNG